MSSTSRDDLGEDLHQHLCGQVQVLELEAVQRDRLQRSGELILHAAQPFKDALKISDELVRRLVRASGMVKCLDSFGQLVEPLAVAPDGGLRGYKIIVQGLEEPHQDTEITKQLRIKDRAISNDARLLDARRSLEIPGSETATADEL